MAEVGSTGYASLSKLLERCLLYLYAAALFLSAALLFFVQPMVAKMILPFLGGSPAVWNTCLFFFQTFLLLGYLYAHFGSSWLGVKRHMILHLVIIAAAIYFLPVTIPSLWLESSDYSPVTLVLWVLLVSVGFPFFVLSASAPLLQKWFSSSGHADAHDPYFLYAASNAGSLLGLIAYPLLLESRLTLTEQSRLWLYIYLGFLAVTFACGMALRVVTASGKTRPTVNDASAGKIDTDARKPTLRRRASLDRAFVCAVQPAARRYDLRHDRFGVGSAALGVAAFLLFGLVHCRLPARFVGLKSISRKAASFSAVGRGHNLLCESDRARRDPLAASFVRFLRYLSRLPHRVGERPARNEISHRILSVDFVWRAAGRLS